MAGCHGLAEICRGEDKLCRSPLLGKQGENIVQEDTKKTIFLSQYQNVLANLSKRALTHEFVKCLCKVDVFARSEPKIIGTL